MCFYKFTCAHLALSDLSMIRALSEPTLGWRPMAMATMQRTRSEPEPASMPIWGKTWLKNGRNGGYEWALWRNPVRSFVKMSKDKGKGKGKGED